VLPILIPNFILLEGVSSPPFGPMSFGKFFSRKVAATKGKTWVTTNAESVSSLLCHD